MSEDGRSSSDHREIDRSPKEPPSEGAAPQADSAPIGILRLIATLQGVAGAYLAIRLILNWWTHTRGSSSLFESADSYQLIPNVISYLFACLAMVGCWFVWIRHPAGLVLSRIVWAMQIPYFQAFTCMYQVLLTGGFYFLWSDGRFGSDWAFSPATALGWNLELPASYFGINVVALGFFAIFQISRFEHTDT